MKRVSRPNRGDLLLCTKTNELVRIVKIYKPMPNSPLENEPFLMDVRYRSGKGFICATIGDRFKIIEEDSTKVLDDILNMFVVKGNEDSENYTKSPFIHKDNIVATDRSSLVYFKKSLMNTEGFSNPSIEHLSEIINMKMYEEKEYDISFLEDYLIGAGVYNDRKIKSVAPKYDPIFKLGVSFFPINTLFLIIGIAKKLKIGTVTVSQISQSSATQFSIGEINMLIMPIMYPNGNGILSIN